MTTTPSTGDVVYPTGPTPIPESICHTLEFIQISTAKKIDHLTKDIERLEEELAHRRAELDGAVSFNQDLAAVLGQLGPVTE